MRLACIAALLSAALAPAAWSAESQVKVAVLDLQERGVDKALASSATSLLASELQKIDVLRVISREDIRNMLQFEKDKESVGCEADQACLAEIGGALGVEYIVAGSLARLGDKFVLSLTLNNVKSAQVDSRASENIDKADQIIAAVGRCARALVGKVLKGREGYLVLSSPEAGAAVKIDGQIRGTTPLRGRLALSWGPHLLELEKQGFVAYSEDISIPNKGALARSVALVPSSDFISAYDSSAKKMRLGAWIASGAAVAAAGVAVAFNALASSNESTFVGERTRYESGDPAVTQQQLSSLSSKGSSEVLAARIGLATALVAGGLATYFWIAGDDPHRYDAFREQEASPALAAVPLEGGGAVAVTGRF